MSINFVHEVEKRRFEVTGDNLYPWALGQIQLFLDGAPVDKMHAVMNLRCSRTEEYSPEMWAAMPNPATLHPLLIRIRKYPAVAWELARKRVGELTTEDRILRAEALTLCKALFRQAIWSEYGSGFFFLRITADETKRWRH